MQKLGIHSFVVATLLAAAPLVHAQQAGGDEEEQSGESLPPLGVAVTEAFNEAIELMDMNNFAQARLVVSELDQRRMSPYEIGRAEQILANIAYAEGDYALMRDHLNKALASGGLSEAEIPNLKFQIAQLFLGDEMYAEAVTAFEEWFPLVTDPNPVAYYLLAVAYYYKMPPDFDKALTNVRTAVELTDEPEEGWLSLLIALLIDREDYEEARDQLQRIVSLAPHKKNYWLQLSSVHSFMDNYEEALATMEIPYLAGMLQDDGTNVRRYADLLLYNRIGHRCGRVLEQAMADGIIEPSLSTYQKLSDCWLQSGELDEAAESLGRAAALADTGKEFVRLGEVEIRRERYNEAATAFQSAMNKGQLEDVDRVELLMGVVLYNGDNPCSAREWFDRARSSDQHRQNAIGYLQLLEIEGCR
jgi:tetratricopeptide (TPR) repeat protein